jgi:hypothetical protein
MPRQREHDADEEQDKQRPFIAAKASLTKE